MHSLQEIGQQLDRNIFPVVKNGGLVVPNPTPTNQLKTEKEKKNENHAQRRPATRSWERPQRWQRQAGGSRKTRPATSIISSHIKQTYKKEFDELKIAYPGIKIWQQDEGLWLLAESTVLPDQWHKVIFVVGMSYIYPFDIRSWGFWISGISLKPVWIGPRHTNFPDGSICAFEPADRTWCGGQSIITLLDLYTLWALRHRHLEIFGRWPGQQAVHHPYERILELKEDEFCGCGLSDKLYKDCCREKDLARDRVIDFLDFQLITGGKPRKPPKEIVDFVNNRNTPPSLNKILDTRPC